jgi:hypothetical protein
MITNEWNMFMAEVSTDAAKNADLAHDAIDELFNSCRDNLERLYAEYLAVVKMQHEYDTVPDFSRMPAFERRELGIKLANIKQALPMKMFLTLEQSVDYITCMNHEEK